jgi:hypothetical protein
MTGLIENGPRSSQKMNSQSSHSNTWWLGGHHLLGSLSLKGRANKYISLKWNRGCESAFLCHLFSECGFFPPRESNYNSMRTHERAENWGDTAGIGCLCRSGATLVRTRSALHEQPSGVRARSITFVFRCGIQGLVCSLEARFSL